MKDLVNQGIVIIQGRSIFFVGNGDHIEVHYTDKSGDSHQLNITPEVLADFLSELTVAG